MRVNAARADQAQQVQSARTCVRHGRLERFVGKELSARDHVIDASDVHLDDASGADVEVPDLAVAHLAFGETDEGAVCPNQRVRIFAPQPVEVRRAGHGDGVVLGIGVLSPAVHDGEDNGTWPVRVRHEQSSVSLCQEGPRVSTSPAPRETGIGLAGDPERCTRGPAFRPRDTLSPMRRQGRGLSI